MPTVLALLNFHAVLHQHIEVIAGKVWEQLRRSIMASNARAGIVYTKIDPSKLSFVDLPLEVREKIEKEYFLPAENYTIHLIRDWSEEDNGPEREKIPTTEHHFLFSEIQTYAGQGNNDNQTTMENVFDERSKVCSVWSNLEAAAKPLCAEAAKYHYLHDSFPVLGDEYESQWYHAKLSVIPYRLLSKIKNLELQAWLFRDVFLGGRGSWMEGPWSTVVGDMVNWRNLHLRELDGIQMKVSLGLMTSRQAFLLGERPQVTIEAMQAGEKLCKRCPTPLSYVMNPPRLIIPPLQDLEAQ